MLEQAKHMLSGDHGTSGNSDHCVGATAHCTDQDWTLQPFALRVKPRSDIMPRHVLTMFWMLQTNGKSRTSGPHSARTALITW
ncbi:hypothetical protein KUCAC02_019508 [Chaenocephalus aceratus]|uniref:Uncharacterized protein n=1 Tax=Chaenocephalus aceratus TaxID=36190 RepID=A0ACB9VPY9_CHAAC|nr:hypothetical protein KUCAC02_019508 [Chaenocephalus aceratus]